MDEQQLINRALSGDLRVYQVLVKRYERLVVHMIGRLIPQAEDVEDLCQDVFVAVYKQLPRYNSRAKLSTWIATIAYHKAINYLKKKKITTGHEQLEDVRDDNRCHAGVTPENTLLTKEMYLMLHEQIARLPVAYKTVITLYHLEEFSYAEIEQITQMPEGTVKNYLFRARKLLKEKLKQYEIK